MREMSIEVLVATMNQENRSFLENMNLTTDAVVVNQNTHREEIEEYISSRQFIHWIDSLEKGLSKSRNSALNHASADICLIADDDMTYHDDYAEKVRKAYQQYPEADIIAFQVDRIGHPDRTKKYRDKKNWENYITSMKISSVEITFKRKSIMKKGLKFNPNIGAGTEFFNGEENAFLYDALRNNCKILYLPIEIAEVDMSESSWFEGYNESYFETVGAKFYNMTNRYYKLLMIQFVLRKYSLYKKDVSMVNAYKFMNKGVYKYKQRYESSN